MCEARGGLEVAVQHERVEVGAVGPYHRSKLIVHVNLREEVGVGERRKHRTMQLSREIDVTRDTIAEAEPQPIVTEHLDRCDSHDIHKPILGQRLNRLRSTAVLRPAPVRLQLRMVQRRPLAHELERATRQIADEHGTRVYRDDRMMLGVLSMEMRRFVIVEVHRDHDAVEEADPGHETIMTSAWDGSLASDSRLDATGAAPKFEPLLRVLRKRA